MAELAGGATSGGLVGCGAPVDVTGTSPGGGGATGCGAAFATLSLTGKLVSFEWPRPGLKLEYLNK